MISKTYLVTKIKRYVLEVHLIAKLDF